MRLSLAAAVGLTLLSLHGCSETVVNPEAEDKNVKTAAGSAFLTKNSSRSKVVTTTSGLQYIVLKQGSGIKPYLSSTVATH